MFSIHWSLVIIVRFLSRVHKLNFVVALNLWVPGKRGSNQRIVTEMPLLL